MFASELITGLIPYLQPSDSCEKALEWMSELHLPHLPVVEDGKCLGIIAEDTLLDHDWGAECLQSFSDRLIPGFINQNEHLLEVIDKITTLKIATIAVCDAEMNYKGVVTQHYLLEYFAQKSGINETGSIIVLELGAHDINFTEISRIIESNDARIFHTYITPTDDPNTLLLTLKINKHSDAALIATFERFNYKIYYHKSEENQDDFIKERYDLLMKYLNT